MRIIDSFFFPERREEIKYLIIMDEKKIRICTLKSEILVPGINERDKSDNKASRKYDS